MSEALNLSTAANFQLRAERLAQLNKEAQANANSEQPTFYQGQDPLTGTAKFKRLGQGTVSGGEVVTDGALAIGQPVIAHSTQGLTRLSSLGGNAGSISCGADGSPRSNDTDPTIRPDRNEPDKEAPPEVENGGLFDFDKDDLERLKCPTAGTVVAGSASCLGLAQTYKIYTGGAAGNPPVCTTQLIVKPNAAECKKPGTPFTPKTGSDGCTIEVTQPQSNCQWINITSQQASDFTGCPTGTTFTGFAELPTGTFRALCCAPVEVPAPVAGIGCGWQLPVPSIWRCLTGVCVEDANGIYATKAECEAALVPANFTGGQCDGVLYRVTVRYYAQDYSTFPSLSCNTPFNATTTADGYGPIQKIYLTNPGSNPCHPAGFSKVVFDARPTPTGAIAQQNIISTAKPIYTQVDVVSVVRVDGLPDTCGNPKPTCP